jgi:oligoendopeptidase F
MEGVPNTAFTEAFAFVFQGNDLMLLGLEEKQSEKQKAFRILDSFWGTREIAAVSLVDMKIWHWMYEHPKASPAELREATLEIAGDVWNEHFAPVFGHKDSYILAIYSHIIHSALYTPDYPIGEMIAVQVRDRMDKAGKIGPEFERMAVIGRVTPDMWMKNATGRSVGAEALLEETEKALRVID